MFTKFRIECTFVHDPLKEDVTVLLMRFLTSAEMSRKLHDETKLVLSDVHLVKVEDGR